MSGPSPKPSIPELREVTQPPSIFARNSGEHWAGKLYVRRVSIHLTRALLPTRVTPNAMTWTMIVVGALAAGLVAIDSVWAAAGAVVLIQLQILLDCSDGEVARWRRQFSPVGIYLDRFAHYFTETLFPIALGIRCDRPELGLIAALLSLAVRTETALVAVARLESGRDKAEDTAAVAASSISLLARVRGWIAFFPFFRAFIAVEASVLSLLAVLFDDGTLWLLYALIPIGAIAALGHFAAIVTSQRLR